MHNPGLNRVIFGGLATVCGFFLLLASIPLSDLIVILNGVFIGAAFAIMVTYWKLLWFALLGVRPYDRVRQMTLGFFLCWIAFALTVSASVWLRSANYGVNSTILAAAALYTAIFAAVLQVTAPDFGFGIFYGRDRKALWTGVVGGLLLALGAIYLQEPDLLAEEAARAIKSAPAEAIRTFVRVAFN